MKKDFFSDKNRFGSYLKISSSNWDENAQALSPEVINQLKPVAPYTKDVDGRRVGVVIIPLNDSAGKRIGALALFDDLSINYKITSSLKITVWLLALFGAVFISGLLLVVVKGGILRPVAELSVAFDSLANGDNQTHPINMADYRGAVKSLAVSYQKLADSVEHSKYTGS
jgi:HAMP domain-containing protein